MEKLTMAYRELALSPYFQQYLGSCPSLSAEEEEFHCFELLSATSLESLLQSRGTPLPHDSTLLRFLSREILLAIIDLHEQSTHELRTRLSPASVFVSASGRRVFLGRLDFGPMLDADRCDVEACSRDREARLLNDLSVLVYAMTFQAVLPSNRTDFASRFLAWKDPTFVCEFLVDSATPKRLVVPTGDAFELVPVVGGFDLVWRVEAVSSATALTLIDQRCFPTLIQCCASTGSSVVSGAARGREPMCASNARPRSLVTDDSLPRLSLRWLLDKNPLFRPLDAEELEQLEIELQDWLDRSSDSL
ncbi:hypothetical protein P43SY_011635 [Pythium insidiosum]|uniref:Uncharacterized protein n=1 Tax=Pythium insidiosum TaxID=114742 RepID=A0AAD5LRP5_PYTIN|nr:hypothetical protein P43SY_011635 [Pythium insidiosum]